MARSPASFGPFRDIHQYIEQMSQPVGGEFGTRTGFDAEWEALESQHRRMTRDMSLWKSGRHPGNRDKNRYMDVLPNESTRVKLQISDPMESDYINSNYIDGKLFHLPHNNYICAQAPNSATVNDFWRMIWENDVGLILMLTKEVERSRNKSIRYWPEVATEGNPSPSMAFGNLVVEWDAEEGCEVHKDNLADVVFRKFKVTCGKASRTVLHVQHTEWPDHGVPFTSSGFRAVLRTANEYLVKEGLNLLAPGTNTCVPPMLIHCSAGVGRTGCFLTIHITTIQLIVHLLLHGTEEGFEFNIHNTILQLRTQRAGIVQSVDQLQFVYTTLREEVAAITKGWPDHILNPRKPRG